MRDDFVPSLAVLEDRHLSRQGPHREAGLRARAEHKGRRRSRSMRKVHSLGALRQAWERSGADVESPHVEQMIARGMGPVSARMPTGMDGAAFMTNLPPEGTFAMNTQVFSENPSAMTSRRRSKPTLASAARRSISRSPKSASSRASRSPSKRR